MRFLTILGLAVMLAACTGQPNGKQPPVEPIGMVSPYISSDAMIMDDGAKLPLRSWLPKDKPRAIILALHGFNDYSNAFAAPGKEWAKHGVATFAYDQRGFGGAPERGRWAGASRSTPTSPRRADCCGRAIPACRCSCSARAWAAPS